MSQAKRFFARFALAFLLPSCALAQSNNPVLQTMATLGQTGASAKSAPATGNTKFQHAGKLLFVDNMIDDIADSKEQKQALRAFVMEIINSYEDLAKQGGFSHDCAASLAFSVCIMHSIATGQEFTDEGFGHAIKALQAALDLPAIKSATSQQKQEAYEVALVQCAFSVFLAATLKEGDGPQKLKQAVSAQIEALTGAKLAQFTISNSGFSLKGTGNKPATPVESSPSIGLAKGFSFSVPAGWQPTDNWFVGTYRDKVYSETQFVSANIRFPAAIPAAGNFSEALRVQWKQNVPSEFANIASGMTYRRYVGDGLFAQFVCGRGRENGKKADTVFTVMLIDCGSQWQPVVIAQTYDETSQFAAGIEMTASLSYSYSAFMAEQMLATLRCQAAKGKPIATAEALAGNYNFGSGSMLQWENVYTGASTFTHVSWGGTLNLKPSGTFTYTYGSASGAGGLSTFRSAKGDGTWKLEGDILITTFKNYDQGDGHFVKEHRYKLAGITQYNDGNKVIVLKNKVDEPANASTVGDSSEYYSTKKKE